MVGGEKASPCVSFFSSKFLSAGGTKFFYHVFFPLDEMEETRVSICQLGASKACHARRHIDMRFFILFCFLGLVGGGG